MTVFIVAYAVCAICLLVAQGINIYGVDCDSPTFDKYGFKVIYALIAVAVMCVFVMFVFMLYHVMQ